MAQPDGQQALILIKLHMQVLYLVLVIFDPGRSCCSSCPVLQRTKQIHYRQKATQIGLSPEIKTSKIINQWNSLLDEVVSAPTISIF